MTIADGGYPGTGLVMPHRRRKGEELPDWKQEHNRSHQQVRAPSSSIRRSFAGQAEVHCRGSPLP